MQTKGRTRLWPRASSVAQCKVYIFSSISPTSLLFCRSCWWRYLRCKCCFRALRRCCCHQHYYNMTKSTVGGRPLLSVEEYISYYGGRGYVEDSDSEQAAVVTTARTMTITLPATRGPLCEGRGMFVRVSIDHENNLWLTLTHSAFRQVLLVPYNRSFVPTNQPQSSVCVKVAVHAFRRFSVGFRRFSVGSFSSVQAPQANICTIG